MKKHNILINIIAPLINQAVAIICGFILPRLLLVYYGSTVNGLVSSITQFLSFITFMEMGIGAVVQSNLYKPLESNNEILLSKIMKSARKFYRVIAVAFSAYVILLCFFYPLTVKASFDLFFTISLIIIISISSLMQYYFGIVNQILLNADQKAYIPSNLQSITLVANTILCYILIKLGFSIQIVKLGTAFIYLFRPFCMYFYVKKNYKIDYSVELNGEPIKQKWNGLAQHLAAMILEHTDITILTIFSTLENVSIYTVYYNVVCGVRRIFSSIIDSLRAVFGNLLVRENKELLSKYFSMMEYAVHFALSSIFACTYILIIPFVKVYTRGINDTNYIVPLFAVLITTAYLFYCFRCFYNMLVLAAGKYMETQNASFMEAVINLTISILFVRQFGLIGVAVGTLCAMAYRVYYLIWYLSKYILIRNIFLAVKHILVDMIVIIISVIIALPFKMMEENYFFWGLFAVKILFMCFVITLAIYFLIYRNETIEIFKLAVARIRKS